MTTMTTEKRAPRLAPAPMRRRQNHAANHVPQRMMTSPNGPMTSTSRLAVNRASASRTGSKPNSRCTTRARPPTPRRNTAPVPALRIRPAPGKTHRRRAGLLELRLPFFLTPTATCRQKEVEHEIVHDQPHRDYHQQPCRPAASGSRNSGFWLDAKTSHCPGSGRLQRQH
jgi:hypothetical protein